MDDTFDVIIVGGGMAGLACAYVLARYDFNVIVVERADTFGEKNVSGGIINGGVLGKIFSEHVDSMPIERKISKKTLSCISGKSVALYEFNNEDSKRPMGVTVLRAKLDKWLGEIACNAGAEAVCGVSVDEILFKNNKAIGIASDGEKLYADVVVIAEGANSLLTERIGFREKMTPLQVGLSVKEIVHLDENVINDRFNIESDEGAAIELFGTFTKQIEGGGFIYTNRNCLSIGVVMTLSSYKDNCNRPYEILEEFKQIPYIKKIIRGGEVQEYSAHLVPEMGFGMKPKLYGNGIMIVGDAAGFLLKNGRTIEGMNYALMSGKLAAETIIEAAQFNSYSEAILSKYEQKLNSDFLFQKLKKFGKSYKFFQNPRLYREYPEFMLNFSRLLFESDESSQLKVSQVLKEAIKSSDITILQMLSDAIINGNKI